MDRSSSFELLEITPPLPSEYSILRQTGVAPPRDGGRYLQVVEADAGLAVFNPTTEDATPIRTREVTISGLTVIFENSDDHPTWRRLFERKDVARLIVCADEIILRHSLILPGTQVSLFARRLRFEGGAAIDTTPLSLTAPADGDVGRPGAPAGAIHLNVREIEGLDFTRLIANGGAGQPARSGKKGLDGQSAPPWDGKAKIPTIYGAHEDMDWTTELKGNAGEYTPIRAMIYEYTLPPGVPSRWTRLSNVIRHEPAWPTDGSAPKVMPGAPGAGGAGGDVYSRSPETVGRFTRQQPGPAGAKAPDLPPAKAGTPVKSCQVAVGYTGSWMPHFWSGEGHGILNRRMLDIYSVDETRVTRDYPAVQAPGHRSDGSDRPGRQLPTLREDDAFWIHPLTLQVLVSHARDAFRAGDAATVRPLVDDYLATLDGLERHLAGKGELPLELAGPKAELIELMRRAESPLDFFGNPAGWVPALSLKSNLEAYANETPDALARLYLSYWMEHNQAGKEARARTIGTTLDQLRKESAQAATEYDRAAARMAELDTDHGALCVRIAGVLDRLEVLHKDLTRIATESLQAQKAWRAAGKILGGIAQVIPVGQPALGAVGKGVSALADYDPDEPFESVKKIGTAVWDTRLVGDVLLPKVKGGAMNLFGITPGEKSELEKDVDKAEYKLKVKKQLSEQSAAKEQVLKAFGSFTASDDEVEAAVEKALAASPEYAEIGEELTALNADKARFAEALLANAATLDAAAATLANNRLAEIELRRALDGTLAGLSPEGLRYVRAMGERALERLQRYEYYFVQSYLYHWLRPLPAYDGDARYLFDEMKRVLQPEGDAVLSGAQFDRLGVVFTENLKRVADELYTYFNQVRPGQPGVSTSSQITVELDRHQLAALNGEAKRVVIDPMRDGRLHLSLEDVRLFNVEVSEARLLDPPEETVDVRVRVTHSGESTLRRDGRLYLFRNTGWAWETMVHQKGAEVSVDPQPPESADDSLLRHLLGDKAGGTPLRARPSAWSPLVIERELMDMRSRYPARFESLTLKITYTARDMDPRYASLFVRVPGDSLPRIGCSERDVGGLGEGEGSFMRTFLKGTRVCLTAPEAYGERAFLGWRMRQRENANDPTVLMPLLTPESADYLGSPDDLVRTPELSLTLDEHYFVEAVYLQRA